MSKKNEVSTAPGDRRVLRYSCCTEGSRKARSSPPMATATEAPPLGAAAPLKSGGSDPPAASSRGIRTVDVMRAGSSGQGRKSAGQNPVHAPSVGQLLRQNCVCDKLERSDGDLVASSVEVVPSLSMSLGIN